VRSAVQSRPFRSTLGAALALIGLLAFAATPAAATPQTLLRGVTNIVFAPLDAALAPISTFVGIRENMDSIDDSPGVRLVYPIPGYFYTLGLQIAGSGIRAITGTVEILPGVLLLFSETDVNPLFATVDDAAALVEFDSDILDGGYRFGINYTTPDF
jgi:hypothetical protein